MAMSAAARPWLVAWLVTLGACASSGAVTQVIIVRHAEKASDAGSDPELSPSGRERARTLAGILADAGGSAVFASEFRRTQQTVAPTAERAKTEPVVVPARDPDGLAGRLRERHRGRVVLVAAHSNTVPAVIRSLGGPEIADLAEDAYDDLFIVTISDGSGAVRLLHLRYPSR
jgi:broad specificity phosphatase PhoE